MFLIIQFKTVSTFCSNLNLAYKQIYKCSIFVDGKRCVCKFKIKNRNEL